MRDTAIPDPDLPGFFSQAQKLSESMTSQRHAAEAHPGRAHAAPPRPSHAQLV